jgi:hypothetical protein
VRVGGSHIASKLIKLEVLGSSLRCLLQLKLYIHQNCHTHVVNKLAKTLKSIGGVIYARGCRELMIGLEGGNARLFQTCDWPKHQIIVVNTPHKIMDQGTILCLSGCPLLPCKTVLSIPTCASLSKSVTSQLCEAIGSCSVNWQKLRTSPRSYRISLGWPCCFGRSGSQLGLLCTPFLLFTSCADALYNPQSRPRV